MNPILSIIIPCFNSEFTLKSTLESVINQDFQDYEVIIVNDGSKDGSQQLIEEYRSNSKYPITLINQENSGNLANIGTEIMHPILGNPY